MNIGNAGRRDPKVFQIGFNKCGTRSLFRFFLANGLPSVHFVRGEGNRKLSEIPGVVARDMLINMTTGRRPFEGYEEFVLFTDIMGPPNNPIFEGQFYFKEIYDAYPNAVFILNTRNEDDWVHSRLQHGKGRLAEKFQKHYHLKDESEVIDLWRRQWRAHHAAVTKFFSDKKDQFIYFDIDRHDGTMLAEALSPYYTLDPAKWGHFNKTKA